MMKRHMIFWIALLSVAAAQAQDWKVLFSANGGFYEGVFELELFSTYPRGHIRYTVNGNRPTAQSRIYTGPFVLDQSLYSTSGIYTIANAPDPDFFLPDSVSHCIVIRAAAFDENDSCISAVATNSYFIRALGCDTHGLPVVSLCADSLDLFDYERGIFVPGIHFDPTNPYFTGNYFMKGREWERLCNFEFYELDNHGINQQVGVRTHGKSARWQSQKGMGIYAREEYGKKRLRYRFFDNPLIDSYKHLTLKPYASSWNGNGCADYICNQMAKQIDVECLDSRPCVLFLNGEYWGIYYVQEKPDEHFLEDHIGVDDDHVNIIKEWIFGECGNPDNYYALYAWMEQAQLNDQEQYSYAESQIDIASFIDYYALELFTGNLDWPSNNVRLWQEGDGPWRWIFYDGDGCLQDPNFDVFANATYDGDGGYPSSRRATLFFRKLLENEGFKEQFILRLNHLAMNEFSYETSKPVYDHIMQALQGEVANQITRFNHPASFEVWENYSMVVVDQFLKKRPQMIMQELMEFMSIETIGSLAFRCYPNPSSGDINLHIAREILDAQEIVIYDLLGRKVFEQPIHRSNGFDEITIQPQLQAGVYLVRIGSHTEKIVRY